MNIEIKMKGKKPFFCAFCAGINKKFTTPRMGLKHSNKYHPFQTPIIPPIGDSNRTCYWCHLEMPYSTFETFYFHLSYCVLNPERKKLLHGFRCRNCDQIFKRKQNLVIHKRKNHSVRATDPLLTDVHMDGNDVETAAYQLISDTIDPDKLVQIQSTEVKTVKKLGIEGRKAVFTFTNLAHQLCGAGYILDVLEIVFGYIIDEKLKFKDKKEEDYLVQITIDSDNLNYPINSPLTPVKSFDLSLFLLRIENIVQSQDRLGISDRLTLTVITCPAKKTRKSRASIKPTQFAELAEFLRRKGGIFDPTCFQEKVLRNACVALAVAISIYSKSVVASRMTKIKSRTEPPQQIQLLLRNIYKHLKQPYGTTIVAKPEIFGNIQKWLQTKFSNYVLLVQSLNVANLRETEVIFQGTDVKEKLTEKSNLVHLLISNKHCYAVLDQKLAFSPHLFCGACLKIVKRSYHKCSAEQDKKCHLCYSTDCYNNWPQHPGRTIYCHDCNKWFKHTECHTFHIENDVCANEVRCRECGKIVSKTKQYNHGCGYRYCQMCKVWDKTQIHKCYVQRAPKKMQKERQIYLFADIESRIDKDSYAHIPIFVYCIRVCNKCVTNWSDKPQPNCCAERIT